MNGGKKCMSVEGGRGGDEVGLYSRIEFDVCF